MKCTVEQFKMPLATAGLKNEIGYSSEASTTTGPKEAIFKGIDGKPFIENMANNSKGMKDMSIFKGINDIGNF